MNNEEMDIYIKRKIKDSYIPEKIDNLFNNSAKIIENKGEKQMEENLNMNQNQEPNKNNQNKQEKKKKQGALKRVLATAACLTLLLGGGNLYATSQGYDNIFFMIKYMISRQDVSGKENILLDRDITISYRPIEISEGIQIQINSLVIKENEAKLKIQVNEKEAKEKITPLSYKVKEENGIELCNYTSTKSKAETNYNEELLLRNYKEETKKLILEILKNDATSIVTLEINLENKEINVIGNAAELTKISEEELKQYLGAFAMLNYSGTEYNIQKTENEKKIITALLIAESKAINVDAGLYSNNNKDVRRVLDKEKIHAIIESFTDLKLNENGIMDFSNSEIFENLTFKKKLQYLYKLDTIGCSPTVMEVTNIDFIGGIYNVTFNFCYSTEENKGFGENSVEDLPVYEMSMGLILDEDNEYSKYRVSTMSEARLVEEEEVKENLEKNKSSLNFDLSFLKLENQKENKIYSPLSIKYALKMLEEAANGESKLQISNLIGNYTLTKYKSNRNMSLANGLFIRDSFNNSIKQKYINTLRTKFNAEIIIDDFLSANNVNSWISNKTLNLIKNMLNEIDKDTNFLLINALGIDMEWEEKFLMYNIYGGVNYEHENFGYGFPDNVVSHKFNNEEKLVSGMEIVASINNYDIVTELGEENIRKTVGDEFRKWAKSLTEDSWEGKEYFDGDLSDANIEKELTKYLDGDKDSEGYMSEINSNYKRVDYSTEFSLYVDDNVKAFSKDLKEYDGTTLQYIGIMPTTKDLDTYIENTDETTINNIISNLKDLKLENFKQGVVTKITGYIPKFKFEYKLNLKQDLEQLGITNVFEQGKANLTEICDDEQVFIDKAIHKANIEFTQDGIKAAAATIIDGMGAGGSFDYIYDIPVEEIDLTFDKPYMFLIRDKETGEIWFTGTVYEPLSWEEEPENK